MQTLVTFFVKPCNSSGVSQAERIAPNGRHVVATDVSMLLGIIEELQAQCTLVRLGIHHVSSENINFSTLARCALKAYTASCVPVNHVLV